MAYLSDSTGRQVTPIARTEGPKDPLPLDATLGHKKAYHQAHGNTTPMQKAKALEESNRQHQQANPSFTPVNQPKLAVYESAEDETEDETAEEVAGDNGETETEEEVDDETVDATAEAANSKNRPPPEYDADDDDIEMED